MRLRIHSQRRWLKGQSTLEIIAVVVIIGVLLSAIIPSAANRVNQALYQKTISEMTAIAQGCVDYYNSQSPNEWPSTTSPWVVTSVLEPTYMVHLPNKDANGNARNPWGGEYEASFQNNIVVIQTTIPSGIAKSYAQGTMLNIVSGGTNDQISIAMTVTNEAIGRLQYVQKYPLP